MKKNKYFFIITTLFLLFCVSLFAFKNRHKIKNILSYCYRIATKSGESANCEGCNDLFNDGIAEHEKAYRIEKIKPQQTDEELKRLESNDFYVVQDLDYSQPLLLPKAISFIDQLSKTYYEECLQNKCSYIPFEITSATRSNQSVKKLMKGNANAIEHSPHLKGKTFDISYAAFTEYSKQLEIFVSVLSELKNQNKCFVKYERNGCLHVTVN